MSKSAVGILALMAGCGGPQSQPVTSTQPAAQVAKAPFEYQFVKKDETPFMGQPKLELYLETTNDVAKDATEEDLKQFCKFIRPTLGKGFVRIFLSTPVPGADAWGVIIHDNSGGTWRDEFIKKESGVDAEPDCFLTETDRSKKNQDRMILTLPVVNRIVEKLVRRGWKIKAREVDSVELDAPSAQSFHVTLWPEEIGLHTFGSAGADLAFTDTVMVLVDELGIGDELKSNLQSVVGGPEYMRAAAGKAATFKWTIGDYLVTYIHYSAMDDLRVEYAKPARKLKQK